MPTFLAFVPSWCWRWIAIAAVGVALFGYGYTKGYLHEEREFALYQAKVDAMARDASAKAVERKKLQDKTTEEVANGLRSDIEDIHAYYAAHPAVVVRKPAGSGAVSAAANCPASTDGPPSEPGATRQDTAVQVSEEACALDAAKVNRWRDFARKNNFPVD